MENREVLYAIPIQELKITVSGVTTLLKFQPHALFNTKTLNRVYQSGVALGYRTLIEEDLEKVINQRRQMLYFDLLKHSNIEGERIAKGFQYAVFSLGIDQGIMLAKGEDNVLPRHSDE